MSMRCPGRRFALLLALLVGLMALLPACALSGSGSTSTTAGPSVTTGSTTANRPTTTTGPTASGDPTASTGSTPATAGSQAGAVNLMASVQGRDWANAAAEPLDQQALAGIRRFSADLLLQSTAAKGNLMVSPVSVYLALAMTLNGADQETRDAMLKTLTGQGITVEMINQASRALSASLAKSSTRTQVSIANSIWFRSGFKPATPFLKANADFYRAGATMLDFSKPEAAGVINGWVNENTRGLIKTIVERIDPSTVMFLINTLYFKSDWAEPFEKHETRKRPFAAPSGPVEAEFMHRTGPMRYFTGEPAVAASSAAGAGGQTGTQAVTGVALPYEDGQFTYFAFLTDPSVSPREWLAARNPATLFETIAGLMAQKSNFTVSLSLPKYEATHEDSLVDDLTRLGMGIAFDGSRADFSRLVEPNGKGLYISEVKHKTFIRVDEKGTEAAAATSVAIDESAPAYDRELVFDRPFIYGILDTKSNLPLFVGILENPAGQ